MFVLFSYKSWVPPAKKSSRKEILVWLGDVVTVVVFCVTTVGVLILKTIMLGVDVVFCDRLAGWVERVVLTEFPEAELLLWTGPEVV